MKYFALSLMVVLAMASVSLAEVTITVDRLPDPAAGLEAYVVHMNGTNTFTNLNIMDCNHAGLGTVHNAGSDDGFGTITQTTFVTPDIPTSSAADFLRSVDTHYLYDRSKAGLGSGSLPGESNSGANEMGLDPAPGTWVYGLGNFTHSGDFVYLESGVLDTDVMQVVIPSGMGGVYLVGSVRDFHGAVDVDIDVPIGVPEPGTIIMLLAGALCLLGIRRK